MVVSIGVVAIALLGIIALFGPIDRAGQQIEQSDKLLRVSSELPGLLQQKGLAWARFHAREFPEDERPRGTPLYADESALKLASLTEWTLEPGTPPLRN